MRKLVVLAAGAIICFAQIGNAFALPLGNEGTCIHRCYFVYTHPGEGLNRCLLACIAKYPTPITQTPTLAMKPEILGNIQLGDDHKQPPMNLGVKSGRFTGLL